MSTGIDHAKKLVIYRDGTKIWILPDGKLGRVEGPWRIDKRGSYTYMAPDQRFFYIDYEE